MRDSDKWLSFLFLFFVDLTQANDLGRGTSGEKTPSERLQVSL